MHDEVVTPIHGGTVAVPIAATPTHGLIGSFLPTPLSFDQSFDWDTPVRLVVSDVHAETIIQANHFTVVSSAFAVAKSLVEARTLLPAAYPRIRVSSALGGSSSASFWEPATLPQQEGSSGSLYLGRGVASAAVAVVDPPWGFQTPSQFEIFPSFGVGASASKQGLDDLIESWWGAESSRVLVTRLLFGSEKASEYSYVRVPELDLETSQAFQSLLSTWRAERSPTDSGTERYLHRAYQQIIGLGTRALPLILKELEKELDHWFWALAAIAREDPVPPQFRGNLLIMREYWLSWGKKQGYRW